MQMALGRVGKALMNVSALGFPFAFSLPSFIFSVLLLYIFIYFQMHAVQKAALSVLW
jgi:hypothetical protein